MPFRYVAIGDSQSEGIGDDPWPDGTPRGWTDRLATFLLAEHPDLTYANLAVRGLRAQQILDTQVAPAAALAPDLVTVTAGVNDILHRDVDAAVLEATLTDLVTPLVTAGARVLLVPAPDLTGLLPFGDRLLRGRIDTLNAVLGRVAESDAVTLLAAPAGSVFEDVRSWAPDRIHLSAIGHDRLARGAARLLGVAGDDDWHLTLPGPPVGRTVAGDLRWAGAYLRPWVGRRLRGRSSADGRVAKRPSPAPPW